jgi:hypothetical protein
LASSKGCAAEGKGYWAAVQQCYDDDGSGPVTFAFAIPHAETSSYPLLCFPVNTIKLLTCSLVLLTVLMLIDSRWFDSESCSKFCNDWQQTAGMCCHFMVQFIPEGSKAALNTNSAQFKRSV